MFEPTNVGGANGGLKGRWKLQFRADFFSAWNHPWFAPVGTSTGAATATGSPGLGKLSSGTFGDFTLGQAGDPRVIRRARGSCVTVRFSANHGPPGRFVFS